MIYAACRQICRPRMFSGEYLWIYIAILVRRRSGNDGVYLVNLSILSDYRSLWKHIWFKQWKGTGNPIRPAIRGPVTRWRGPMNPLGGSLSLQCSNTNEVLSRCNPAPTLSNIGEPSQDSLLFDSDQMTAMRHSWRWDEILWYTVPYGRINHFQGLPPYCLAHIVTQAINHFWNLTSTMITPNAKVACSSGVCSVSASAVSDKRIFQFFPQYTETNMTEGDSTCINTR